MLSDIYQYDARQVLPPSRHPPLFGVLLLARAPPVPAPHHGAVRPASHKPCSLGLLLLLLLLLLNPAAAAAPGGGGGSGATAAAAAAEPEPEPAAGSLFVELLLSLLRCLPRFQLRRAELCHCQALAGSTPLDPLHCHSPILWAARKNTIFRPGAVGGTGIIESSQLSKDQARVHRVNGAIF